MNPSRRHALLPNTSLTLPLPAWPGRDADHLLVSGSQMAELERQLFASGLPVEALMEKAALAVSRRLLADHSQRLRRHGALVLVGPGHNGGDGLVIARELQLAGVATSIWSPFSEHKPLTACHWRHALWLGIERLSQPPPAEGPALWIDAMFGIGQRRPPGAAIETLLAERQRLQPAALVAVDVPTGICADSGRLLGAVAARACTTYSIGLIKTGLVQDQALTWVGKLERIDLALPRALLERLPQQQPLALAVADLAELPGLPLDPALGKYGRGRLLVVAGSDRYRGAAALALAGATASGCGSVRAALPEAVAAGLWQSQPQVVIQRSLASCPAGGLALGELQSTDLQRLDALVVGPGIGTAVGEKAVGEKAVGDQAVSASAGGGAYIDEEISGAELDFWQALHRSPALLLLDADGLNRLAGPIARQFGVSPAAWLSGRVGPSWITPHAGEFARLFPELASLPALEAAAAAARASGAAVLLKGARTVVAAPDGRCWQLRQAASAVARAGLGDVLAGYAGGLGALALAAGWPADAQLLAAAALAHASTGLRLQQNGLAASPEQLARQLPNYLFEGSSLEGLDNRGYY
jgi:NAD(P)H-hydrate epimerase